MKSVNLHLNLSQTGFGGSCGAEAPYTPLEQISTRNNGLQRLNSVSSAASSSAASATDDEMDEDWTAVEDDLVMRVYQQVTSNPTVAPFAGRVPPFNIMNKVARHVVKQAPREGLSFQHSIPNVRRRLQLLCKQPAGRSNPPQESPTLNQMNPLNLNNVINADYNNNYYNDNNQAIHTPASSRPTTPVIDESLHDRNREIQSWLMQQQAPSPPQAPLFEFPPRSTSTNTRPLASPFQEHLAPTLAPPLLNQPDPYPSNFTSHRKKESMKMKRMNGK